MKINKKKIQYASMSTVFIALFAVVIILLNILASFLTERFSIMLDLTDNESYTISDQTKEVLADLDEELTIYITEDEATITGNDVKNQIAETAKRFASASGGKIKCEFVNRNQNPKFDEQFGDAIKADEQNPALIVVSGEKRAVGITLSDVVSLNDEGTSLFFGSESELTAAVLRVTSEQVATVAIIDGHDEMDLPEFERLIRGKGYDTIDGLDLAKDEIPENVNNVAICAPKKDYTNEEIDKLDAFLKIPGNNLFVFWRSDLITQLPNLSAYLQDDWGIVISNETVTDFRYCIDGKPTTVVTMLATGEDNPAVAEIPAGTDSVLYACDTHVIGSDWTNGEDGDKRILTIATSSPESFARLYDGTISYEDAQQEAEPTSPYGFAVAAVSERARYDSDMRVEENKVFVFGSEKFVTAETMQYARSYNASVMNYLFQYANPNTATADVAPKMLTVYDLDLTAQEANIFKWILLAVIPILILATGIFIFVRRRYR